jgi:TRAP-type C4-dicarboxylate transport system substrate-binding protein
MERNGKRHQRIYDSTSWSRSFRLVSKTNSKIWLTFRKYKFRTPPGIPGQTYKDIGIASVAMGGGDILPALEAGTIDAAEWCCPKPDLTFGFQKVLKHYYLQGFTPSSRKC